MKAYLQILITGDNPVFKSLCWEFFKAYVDIYSVFLGDSNLHTSPFPSWLICINFRYKDELSFRGWFLSLLAIFCFFHSWIFCLFKLTTNVCVLCFAMQSILWEVSMVQSVWFFKMTDALWCRDFYLRQAISVHCQKETSYLPI